MNIQRIARLAGVLYLLTVLVFPLSNLAIRERLIEEADVPRTLELVAQHAHSFRAAVAINLLAMVGVMALAVSLYLLLKRVNPTLALMALGWRTGEVILQAAAAIPDTLLLTLGQQVGTHSALGQPVAEMLGSMLIAGATAALWISFVFFSFGSLVNNYLFVRGREIPAALAWFGWISAGLYTAGSLLVLLVNLPEVAKMALMFPLVVFELSLGFYLAVFGIRKQTST